MLSILPGLLSLQGFAPLLLRVLLGAIFLLWAYDTFKKRQSGVSSKWLAYAALEGIVGFLLVVGFLTQVAALVSAVIFGIRIYHKIRAQAFLTNGVNYYLILFIISLSLIFTGAGFLAFDLPL